MKIMDKKDENAIVDAPRYECAEMAARFALQWLDRTQHHLTHIKRDRRSYYHDQLVTKAHLLEHELVDLVIKLDKAYGGYGLTKNNDLIYKPVFDEDVKNVYSRPGTDKPIPFEPKDMCAALQPQAGKEVK